MPCVNITDNADCRVSVQGQCIFDEPKKASNASSEATEELPSKSYVPSAMNTQMNNIFAVLGKIWAVRAVLVSSALKS